MNLDPKLVEAIDKHFPKGKCKERGEAMVLAADFLRWHMEQKTVPIKTVLKLIALQAAGNNTEFQETAVKLAYELDKTDSELAQYILAQYKLIPTWTPQ